MKGMILAAGYGTRFRPATYELPKPMLPVCNRPLIGWAVESLLAAGVSEIVVNLHHLPNPIKQYLNDHYGSRCRFTFSFEPEILGTGGGVRKVRKILEAEEAFLLINGDTIQQPPFEKLLDSLKSTGSLAALLLRPAPSDDRFTPVMFDGRFVIGFGEGPGQPLMFAGAHAISSRIFEFLPDRPFSGLTEDVYVPLTERGWQKISGVVYNGLWFDIGTPRRYLSASAEIRELMMRGGLPVPPGSRIDRSTRSILGVDSTGEAEESVAGAGCNLAGGASIRNSILWNEVRVDPGARIDGSIIGQGVSVSARSRIRNALVCRRLPEVTYEKVITISTDVVATVIDPSAPFEVQLRGS